MTNSDQQADFGGVLSYRTGGHNKACGQVIGANGSGEFVYILKGNSEDCYEWARNHLDRLQKAGHKLDAIYVNNETGYSGPMIQVIDTRRKPIQSNDAYEGNGDSSTTFVPYPP